MAEQSHERPDALAALGDAVTDREDQPNPRTIEPLPYQVALRDYLQREERELWEWFASHQVQKEQADAVRLELLKSTYRVDRQSSPALYAVAKETATSLSLDVPVTIYQAQKSAGLNASLAYLPGEAHVVLHGPIGERLDRTELRALFAHELGHLVLWHGWNGDYLIVDQLLAALTHDRGARPPHFATARLFNLYNEVYCDRVALGVVSDPLPVIAMLVKIETEVSQVDAAGYLRQAEEVFLHGSAKSAAPTHPEAFIRARALKLWHEGSPDGPRHIDDMIQGRAALDELDLLGQERIAACTRRLVDALLKHRWLQTEAVMAHARLFFNDYVPPPEDPRDQRLAADLATDDDALQDYYSFVLLDFVSADRDLEEAPLAAALAVAERIGLKERFTDIAACELRLRKKQVQTIDREQERILADASRKGFDAVRTG